MNYSDRLQVAAEVRAEMARKQVTKKELSVQTGMSLSTLQRRLYGTYPFTVEELLRVATALDAPISQFFKGEAA